MDAVAADPERRPRLLVLGAGPSQLGLLEAARAHGVWTVVCDRDPTAPGFRYADRRALVSTDDEPAIERLAGALELDGVIAPGADWPVAVAARVAEKLRLPHAVSPATAVLATNKLRQREALAAAGVPQPRWQVVADGDGIELEPPLVVKAADRHGQQGFSLVAGEDELAEAVAAARASSRSGAVLVEEEVEGPEVTLVGFAAEGELITLAVTDRLIAEPPAYGVGLAEVWPSPHAEAAAEVTRRAVEALGIAHGPVCAHLRVSRGGPEVVSVSARLGGDHDAELVEAVTGVDLNRLALEAALGEAFESDLVTKSHELHVGGAVTRFLVAPPGTLEAVVVPQGLSGVVRTWLYREPGHVFAPLHRRSDRAGALLAVGATAPEALVRADAAAEQIRFATADAEALV
jgi:biotin carboxylase